MNKTQILCPVEIFDVTCSLVILFPPHNMKAIDIPIHKGYGVSFHDINHIYDSKNKYVVVTKSMLFQFNVGHKL